MSDTLITFDYKQLRRGNLFRALLINAAINFLIAVILTAIGFGPGFVVNLVFSQCIGMSIFFANLAAIPLFRIVTGTYSQLAVIVGAVIVGATAGTLLGALANGINPVYFVRENSVFFGQVILIGLMFGFIISYVFISLGKISEEKVRRLEAEKYGVETELKLLQSQMEPHFLFNTLSNVLSLIDTDRERARQMLEAFTLFLRSSVLTARRRTVPLSHEIEIVSNYLKVFGVRMGRRLRYRILFPDELRDFPVPPLLVQPLVENAIKHGLEPLPEGGEIDVQAVRDGDGIRIMVVDSGMGMQESSPGTGIGLENIRKRLDLVYEGRAVLKIEENTPRGIRVTVGIPYETDTNHHR